MKDLSAPALPVRFFHVFEANSFSLQGCRWQDANWNEQESGTEVDHDERDVVGLLRRRGDSSFVYAHEGMAVTDENEGSIGPRVGIDFVSFAKHYLLSPVGLKRFQSSCVPSLRVSGGAKSDTRGMQPVRRSPTPRHNIPKPPILSLRRGAG